MLCHLRHRLEGREHLISSELFQPIPAPPLPSRWIEKCQVSTLGCCISSGNDIVVFSLQTQNEGHVACTQGCLAKCSRTHLSPNSVYSRVLVCLLRTINLMFLNLRHSFSKLKSSKPFPPPYVVLMLKEKIPCMCYWTLKMRMELKNRQANSNQNVLLNVYLLKLLLSWEELSQYCPMIPNPCYVPFRNQNLRKIFGNILSVDKLTKY